MMHPDRTTPASSPATPAAPAAATSTPAARDSSTKAAEHAQTAGKGLIGSLLRWFSWSDTPKGILLDPIPNPKRYLVILGRVSIELGKPGWGIGRR